MVWDGGPLPSSRGLQDGLCTLDKNPTRVAGRSTVRDKGCYFCFIRVQWRRGPPREKRSAVVVGKEGSSDGC